MQDFESIRPYRDDEVPGVVSRLAQDSSLIHAASRLFTPKLARLSAGLAEWIAARILRRQTRGLRDVNDVQALLEGYMEQLVNDTIAELTFSGLEAIDAKGCCLFISNHRDIMMDTCLINYVIYQAGHETSRVAVGDNLLSEAFAADLMRLNKSFVIERGVVGKRAVYNVLVRTSAYIRHSLETGNSVWIAQREGRAKDGFDRTDPALLKMLSLAWRDEFESFADLLGRVAIIPVSISYELDPCDRQKAHELAVLERRGEYIKNPDEDLMNMVLGMSGYKGRVHLHFSPRLRGDFADSESMALALDRAIVGGTRIFPTQAAGARALSYTSIPEAGDWLPQVRELFDERTAQCPPDELPYLLASYGNLIRNRNELNIQQAAGEPPWPS